MGKNKKNRQKQQQNVQHQIPIITATATIDDCSDASNQPEPIQVSPVIFVEEPVCFLQFIIRTIFCF